MRRVLENALALAIAISVPTLLLWLLGMAYGALQDATWWQTWTADAIGWLWAAAALGGTLLLLYLINALMRLAIEWPPRWRK